MMGDMNTQCGTPVYMAPEVGDPLLNYGIEADLWSIGLIFLEMLLGNLPWKTV
jgi:serine/threonine protein kinase